MPAPTLATLAALAGFATKVVVGVAEFGVSNNPVAELTTYSLGSCLGISIYDPVTKAGGLLHAMLPDSAINPAKARPQPGMFVDTGVPALFRAAYVLGAAKHRVEICVAGGAQITNQGPAFNIGERNHAALTALLREHGLRIQAEDVGGFVIRTMTLHLGTGEVRLKLGGCATENVLFRH